MFILPGLKGVVKKVASFSNAYSTSFNGSTQYVTLGEPSDLIINPSTTEFTIACWINTTNATVLDAFIAKAQPGVPNICFMLGVGASGQLYGYCGNSGQNTSSNNSLISANTWYFVGMTVKNISGTQTMSLWINGVKVTGVAGSGLDITVTSTNTASGVPVILGAAGSTGNTRQYPGNIDEVTFWGVGFDSTAWLSLYNSGVPNDPTTHAQASHLLHWYRMGDGDTSPTILDHKGSANGTMTNMSGTNFVTSHP